MVLYENLTDLNIMLQKEEEEEAPGNLSIFNHGDRRL